MTTVTSPDQLVSEARLALAAPELTCDGLEALSKVLELAARVESPPSAEATAWVDAQLPPLVDRLLTATPSTEVLPSLLRCLGDAATSAASRLKDFHPPPTDDAAAAVAFSPSPSEGSPEHPALRWLVLLSRITDVQSPLWAHVTVSQDSHGMSISSRGPAALTALAADLLEAGCVDAALSLLREVRSTESAAGIGPERSNVLDLPDPPAVAAASADAPPPQGAPAVATSVDVVESVVVLVSQMMTVGTARPAQPTGGTLQLASNLVTRAVGRLDAKTLKRAEAQRLLLAAQQLQLLAPLEAPAKPATAQSTSAPASGFTAVVPPRVAICAKALASPTLTLRLWGVKDLSSLISQATALADGEAAQAPLVLCEALRRESVPALLLGAMAHEEVVSRSSPIFTLLLSVGQLDDETLRSLWEAPATKSSAVAASATSLLSELLRSPKCPSHVHLSLLEAVGDACKAALSVGLSAVLATLAPIYSALAPAISERLLALLWTLLATLTPDAPAAAAASLRATLVSTLRSGSADHRHHAIAVLVRPLQRACQLASAASGGSSSRPTHRRGGSQGQGGSMGSGALASLVGLGGGGGGDEGGGSVYASASSGLASSLGGSRQAKPPELSPALVEAAERLPISMALELLRAVGESEALPAKGEGASLVATLEPRHGLLSLAQQLVAIPVAPKPLPSTLSTDANAAATAASASTSAASAASAESADTSASACGPRCPSSSTAQSSASSSPPKPADAAARPLEPSPLLPAASIGASGGGASGVTVAQAGAVGLAPGAGEAPGAGVSAAEGEAASAPSLGSHTLSRIRNAASSASCVIAGSASIVPSADATADAAAAAAAAAPRSTAEATLRSDVLARLQFLAFVSSELKALISKAALEAAWAALPSPQTQEAFLQWLPSALSSLAPDALAYGYVELVLKELRWDELTVRQYEIFEVRVSPASTPFDHPRCRHLPPRHPLTTCAAATSRLDTL